METTRSVRRLLRSDTFVYFSSGLFAILVFAAAIVVVDWYLPTDLVGGNLSGLITGFSAFMSFYFVSFGVWYYIRRWGDSDQFA